MARAVSLSALVELCQSLCHNLGAGLTLLSVFRQQAKRGCAARWRRQLGWHDVNVHADHADTRNRCPIAATSQAGQDSSLRGAEP